MTLDTSWITAEEDVSSNALSQIDATLLLAYCRWKTHLADAKILQQAGQPEVAVMCASEAIRLSADVHPQYHFLESGLHTALGALHVQYGEYDDAKRHFERAVFLHHDNPVALAGVAAIGNEAVKPPSPRGGEGITLPPYTHAKAWAEWQAFCGAHDSEHRSGIFEAWQQAERAEKNEAISLYTHAITLCDATHRQYHAMAAEPWWLRAALHRALGEHLLAMNDLKRGLDLDRQNAWALQQLAELKEIS